MIRVFPRKTNATPDDNKVYFDGPNLWGLPKEEVFVSCTFTFDKPRAEHLASMWYDQGYKVQIGGPAYDDHGGEFVPGRFIKKGMVITSRGCNNSCWFCKVPKREGNLRELEIKEGYDILDNNLLQCSRSHVEGVFEMLNRQDRRDNKGRRLGVKFTGGLEALELKDWHVNLLAGLKPKPEIMYFAYDTPDDYDPLYEAAKKMKDAGFSNQRVGCYVLMGWAKDTIEAAQKRLQQVVDLNMMPYAMLFANQEKNVVPEWRELQRNHTRPQITRKIYKNEFGKTLTKKG